MILGLAGVSVATFSRSDASSDRFCFFTRPGYSLPKLVDFGYPAICRIFGLTFDASCLSYLGLFEGSGVPGELDGRSLPLQVGRKEEKLPDRLKSLV